MTEPLLFAPALGDPGSWTRLPNGNIGQVWIPAGCRRHSTPTWQTDCQHTTCPPAVWVADGHRFHLVERTDLASPVADAHTQPDLFG